MMIRMFSSSNGDDLKKCRTNSFEPWGSACSAMVSLQMIALRGLSAACQEAVDCWLERRFVIARTWEEEDDAGDRDLQHAPVREPGASRTFPPRRTVLRRRGGPRSRLDAPVARDHPFRPRVGPILGFGARPHGWEQYHDQDGHAQQEGGARDGGQLQRLGERLAGGVEQPGTEWAG
jgi:hypothetical protein